MRIKIITCLELSVYIRVSSGLRRLCSFIEDLHGSVGCQLTFYCGLFNLSSGRNHVKDGMKIMVAYDGSEHADNALSEAILIAKKFKGSITIFRCWEKSEEDSNILLKGTEEQLKEAGVKYELRSEQPRNIPGRIVYIADSEGFDAIFIGSRGIGGTKAWLMGSVSNKVAAEAHCPVVIVK